MTAIFISYRRSDDPYAARSINDALCNQFDKRNIYFDLDTLQAGLDWRKQIDGMVAKCDLMLVIIGDNWLQLDDSGQSRLDNEDDLVRLEVSSALKRDIPVIPVLVGHATIPSKHSLIKEVESLVYRQAVEVRATASFGAQIDRLLQSIKAVAPEEIEPEVKATVNFGARISRLFRDRKDVEPEKYAPEKDVLETEAPEEDTPVAEFHKAVVHSIVSPPMWVLASVALALLTLVYLTFSYNLSSYSDPLHAQLLTLGREESLLPTRLLAPPSSVYIPNQGPSRFGLKAFLEPEISRGQVTVDELPDRIVISISSDNLFDSGTDVIKTSFLPILNRIAEGLRETSGRIKVFGHTDNVPMDRNTRFGSSLILSTSRAESVVKVLQTSVDNPSRLKAEGLGETRPIAPNSTPQGRAKNRRVEITILERARAS